MTLREAWIAIPKRLQRPVVLGGIVILILGQTGLQIFVSWFQLNVPTPSPLPPPSTIPLDTNALVLSALSTTLGSIYLLVVSPFPWQWTGDTRRLTNPLQGILKSSVLTLAYFAFQSVLNWTSIQRTLSALAHDFPGRRVYVMLIPNLVISFVLQCLIGFSIALWEKRKAEKAESERQVEEARWTLLKAQMSPHVLLNSLNGLAELVREDTAAAVQGMRDLAEIYGQLLKLGEAPKVPLAQERHLLERYLAVEQLRLGQLLRVEWDWDATLNEIEVMPLLLQPLVENAIKHGVAADPNGGLIHISCQLDVKPGEKALSLCVANTGSASHSTVRKSTGVGLRNLKARLEMAYRGAATFDLVKETPWTKAELHLPLEEKP